MKFSNYSKSGGEGLQKSWKIQTFFNPSHTIFVVSKNFKIFYFKIILHNTKSQIYCYFLDSFLAVSSSPRSDSVHFSFVCSFLHLISVNATDQYIRLMKLMTCVSYLFGKTKTIPSAKLFWNFSVCALETCAPVLYYCLRMPTSCFRLLLLH